MSVWRDMAHDAGYRGDEADQAARMLEEQERERWERREKDRRVSGLPPICEACGAPVILYDALVDRMVPHDCQPKSDGSGTTCTCGTTRPDEQTHTPDCAITKEVTK